MIAAVALAAVALTVSPGHLSLQAGSRADVHVRGGAGLVLHASVAGLALDPRGRPHVVTRRDAGPWLTVRPAQVRIGRDGAAFVVTARRVPNARPGDHTAIVLLTATAPGSRAIAVGLRVGLVVTVRVDGPRVRRLAVVAANVLRTKGGSLLTLTIANRGNVIEAIGGPRLQLTLLRHGHVIARLRGPRRALLPHTRAIVRLRWHALVRGPLIARVALPAAVRSFRLRL